MLTVGSAAPSAVLAKSELAAAEGMALLWGSEAMGTVLVLGGIAGILTSWNGFLIGASRLMYAMGQTAMLPRWFAHIHPRYRTPSNALLFIGGLSVAAPLFGAVMLDWLVTAGGLSLVIAYFMVATSFVVLRVREPEMDRPFRLSGGMVVGPAAALLSLGLGVLYLPGMPAALGMAEWVIIAGWWALGVVFFVKVPHVGHGPDALQRIEEKALSKT